MADLDKGFALRVFFLQVQAGVDLTWPDREDRCREWRGQVVSVMMHGGRLLATAAILWGAPGTGAAWADLPPPLLAEAVESARICKDAGGTPRFQGVQVPGAGRTAEAYVPYVTEADLNGDGLPDYITDLAGLECENAWTIFCGSAGCPVAVWLSSSGGLAVAWGNHAQAWRQDGTAVIMSLHGAMCTPPLSGHDGCEVVLRFDRDAGAPAAGADGKEPAPPASSARPRQRPADAEMASAPLAPAPAASAPPMPSSDPGSGWTYGPGTEEKSWQAGVGDAEHGTRIDWLCAHGKGSVLALSPYDGDGGFVVSGGMRREAYVVTVEDGVAYAPIGIATPLFQHIASDTSFEVSDGSGRLLGRFPMIGAASAIGQAEGRCQAGV